jgi:hypothetical protein
MGPEDKQQLWNNLTYILHSLNIRGQYVEHTTNVGQRGDTRSKHNISQPEGMKLRTYEFVRIRIRILLFSSLTFFSFTSVFKDKKSIKSNLTAEIKGFIYFFLFNGRVRIRIRNTHNLLRIRFIICTGMPKDTYLPNFTTQAGV